MKANQAAKNTSAKISRNFGRHLCKGMKVHIVDSQRIPSIVKLNNISMGGLSFTGEKEMLCGSIVTIRAESKGETYRMKATVAWVRKNGREFDIGLEFAEPRYTKRARVMGSILTRGE